MSVGVCVNLMLMCYDDDGFSFFVQAGQKFHHLGSSFTIQGSSRLVCEDEEWISDECSGDRNPLLLSSGHLVREVVHLFSESHFSECFHGALGPFFFSDSLVDEWHNYLIECGRLWEEIVALEYKSDIFSSYESLIIIGEMGNIFSFKEVLARCWIVEHSDDIHESGFTASGLPHDGDELPFMDFDVDSLQNPQLVFSEFIGFCDVAHLNK